MIHKHHKDYLKTYFWEILLIGLLILHWFANLYWLKLNNAPAPWDPAAHTYITLDIRDNLEKLNFYGLINSSNYYPILIHFISALVLMIINPLLNNTSIVVKIIQLFASIYFLITLIIVYIYTDNLLKNRKIAFFTTAIFSLFPIIFSQSRWLFLDIPLTGVFLLNLLFLEKTHHFTNRKKTLIFFVFTGILLLTKWTGFIYLLIPVLIEFFLVLKKGFQLKTWLNIVIGMILGILIILPWYLPNATALINQSKINATGELGADPSNLLTKENLTEYLLYFVNFQVTPILALLFILFAIYLLFKKEKHVIYLLSLISIYYTIFTFIGNKDPRYTIPILPFVAIIIALGLNKLESQFKKLKLLTPLCLLVLISYFLILTIRPTSLEGKRLFFFVPYYNYWINVIDITDVLSKKYDPSTWKIDEVVSDFKLMNTTPNTRILVISEYETFNPSTLSTYGKAARLSNIAVVTPDVYYLEAIYNQNYFPSQTNLEEYLSEFDYVFVSMNQLGPHYLRNRPALDQLRAYFVEGYFNYCSQFVNTNSNKETKCLVKDGESLSTTSDVLREDGVLIEDKNSIQGPQIVYCKYGCSFQLVKKSDPKPKALKYNVIKNYLLDNGETINLYKIN